MVIVGGSSLRRIHIFRAPVVTCASIRIRFRVTITTCQTNRENTIWEGKGLLKPNFPFSKRRILNQPFAVIIQACAVVFHVIRSCNHCWHLCTGFCFQCYKWIPGNYLLVVYVWFANGLRLFLKFHLNRSSLHLSFLIFILSSRFSRIIMKIKVIMCVSALHSCLYALEGFGGFWSCEMDYSIYFPYGVEGWVQTPGDSLISY